MKILLLQGGKLGLCLCTPSGKCISVLVPLIRVPKKAHDWTVEQLTDLFRTTDHTKTEHVTQIRGRQCGDIELAAYLTNTVGPVSLVLDLLIVHDRFGSNSDPSINGHLQYPNDMDESLNESLFYNFRSSVSAM
jgi:hypothetical protein